MSGEKEFDEQMEELRSRYVVGHALDKFLEVVYVLRDEGFLTMEEFQIIEHTMEGASGRFLEGQWGLDGIE